MITDEKEANSESKGDESEQKKDDSAEMEEVFMLLSIIPVILSDILVIILFDLLVLAAVLLKRFHTWCMKPGPFQPSFFVCCQFLRHYNCVRKTC